MSFHIFLSASAADHEWLDELRTHLRPYGPRGVVAWDERDIPAGARRRDEVKAALGRAKLAILLVSPDYLAETFVPDGELHEWISTAVAVRGLRIAWIPISASAHAITDISEYDYLHDPKQPLDGLDSPARSQALVAICARIAGRDPPEPRPERSDGTGTQNRLLLELTQALHLRNEKRKRGESTRVEDTHIAELRKALLALEPLQPGEVLGDNGQYHLVRELGPMPCATVWLATERATMGKKVAIKVLDRKLIDNRAQRERFLHGARLAMDLRHEAIVDILDPQGEDRGQLFYVMEHIDGTSLHEALRRQRFEREQCLDITRRISAALDHAHTLGIVHGDVQPANIILASDLKPHLLGFDLALSIHEDGPRVPRTGPYVAPELQDPTRTFDARADVYGLARTVQVMLANRRGQPAVAASHGDAVARVLEGATATEPELRPASAGEFCRLLAHAWGAHIPAPASPSGPPLPPTLPLVEPPVTRPVEPPVPPTVEPPVPPTVEPPVPPTVEPPVPPPGTQPVPLVKPPVPPPGVWRRLGVLGLLGVTVVVSLLGVAAVVSLLAFLPPTPGEIESRETPEPGVPLHSWVIPWLLQGTPVKCGDGVIADGEACDDGNKEETDACLPTCVAARCGDSLVWAGREECDDGNRDDTDACTSLCKTARCGDGFVRAGVEACDDGNAVNDDACSNACAKKKVKVEPKAKPIPEPIPEPKPIPLLTQLRGIESNVIKTCGGEVPVFVPITIYVSLDIEGTAVRVDVAKSVSPKLERCVAHVLQKHAFTPCGVGCEVKDHKFAFVPGG